MPASSTRLKRLKKLLLDRKRRLWNELRDELFRKLGREYNAMFENPNDIEELAMLDVIEETGLAVADIKRKELEDLDAALRRLEEGGYGVCSECNAEIDEERLKVVLFATACVKCAGGLEK